MRSFLIRILQALVIVAVASSLARADNFMYFKKKAAAGGVAYPGFTYDVVEDFEDALSGSWSEVDTGSILDPNDATAEYRGTNGMSVASGSATFAYALYTLSAAKTTLSVGVWYKTGAYAGWSGLRGILSLYNNAQGDILRFTEGRDAGSNARRMGWNLDVDPVTVSDDTWYWVTIKFVKNGACSASVYDTAGSQVGSTMAGTASDYSIDVIRLGQALGVSSTSATYFDEFYVDYTDATFPLGPPQ
ncbi:MAG: hypothetical protein WA058_01005 [Minisyncoccia bacterium]